MRVFKRIKRDTMLGRLIYSCRAARNMSLMTVSRKAHVAYLTVFDIENGIRREPGIETVAKIATAIKADPKKVFEAVMHDATFLEMGTKKERKPYMRGKHED